MRNEAKLYRNLLVEARKMLTLWQDMGARMDKIQDPARRAVHDQRQAEVVALELLISLVELIFRAGICVLA